jgi:hypothetical protein
MNVHVNIFYELKCKETIKKFKGGLFAIIFLICIFLNQFQKIEELSLLLYEKSRIIVDLLKN